MKEVMDASKGFIIDGNWTTIPDEAVSAPLTDILLDARRMPEMYIVLRCKEETTFKRCMDEEVTKKKFDEIEKKIKKEIADETEKERKVKLDEVQASKDEELKALEEEGAEAPAEPMDVEAEMKAWDAERLENDEAAFEGHEDKPSLEEMIDAEKEALRE